MTWLYRTNADVNLLRVVLAGPLTEEESALGERRLADGQLEVTSTVWISTHGTNPITVGESAALYRTRLPLTYQVGRYPHLISAQTLQFMERSHLSVEITTALSVHAV